MDKALQTYYEETFSMMATEGWKALIEDFEKIKTSLNDVYTVKDEQQLKFRQGQLDILDLVLNRKAMCEEVYEDIVNEKNI
jgi:hypothetical protein